MRSFTKKLFAIALLFFIGFSIPLNASVLCFESDGSSSIEYAPLGYCELPSQNESGDLSLSAVSDHSHSECHGCTDVSLEEEAILQSSKEIELDTYSFVLPIPSQSIEIPIFTEPISDSFPQNRFRKNPLHQYLQTTILII